MCGSETPVTLVEIDHVELYACSKCARFGKPVIQRIKKKLPISIPSKRQTKKIVPKRIRPPKKDFLHDKILIDGYGAVISEARRERGFGRAEFAQMIKEKETLLSRIEAEKVLPTDRVVAKIERELDIELKTEVSDESTPVSDFISKSTTLGSIAKIKRRKSNDSSQ
jgi:putative transcription factor